MSEITTILVVDDIPENIQVLQEVLKSSYKVKAATSGEKALELIEKDPPDLILLDVMMPGMSGHEVCEILKSQAKTKDIPIIFGILTTENVQQAQDRVGGTHGHKGVESVDTAIEMVSLFRQIE